ncbi:MAG: permease-like cell division protein FtsX [Gammaproteobacteria bacterium]|nr:permease-like cell division protein FtsX [Gammaproteobacteria bacterium]
MKNYFLRHFQVLFFSLGQLAKSPVASLMTIGVIGITLALPSGLYLLIDNVQRLSVGWNSNTQISVFIKKETSEAEVNKLVKKLKSNPAISSVQFISSQQALAEFKELSAFGDVLNSLDHNPLPDVLLVEPKKSITEHEDLKKLVAGIAGHSEVDIAQLDLQWVRRFHAALNIVQRGILLLASLLGLAVLLTISNTIRLAILNRRQEIEITKLIGGTDSFIRRPFLYSGWLQGMFGAILAWLLIHISLLVLAGPVGELTHLYASEFRIQGMGAANSLSLVAMGGVLGWLGSRLAVGRHLREIEPR